MAPLQTASAAGQTAQVGAAVPSPSLSGPGELDLFGQVVPTKPQFEGPIRPLLKLTHITIDAQVAHVLRSDTPRNLELNLSQQLAQGWTRYFEWETLIAAGTVHRSDLYAARPRLLSTGMRLREIGATQRSTRL